jgi:hypothetical protein
MTASVENFFVDQVERNAFRRKKGEETEKFFRRRLFESRLFDGEAEGAGHAVGISLRRARDACVDLVAIGVETHACAGKAAIGARMIERERKAAERLCQAGGAGRVLSSGARLQEMRGRVLGQQIELDLGGASRPIGPPRCEQYARSAERQKLADGLGTLDVVIDQQERRGEAGEPRQSGLGGLVLIGFICPTRIELAGEHGEARCQ